jgi:RNA polymerase-associated protein CTR9
VVSVGKAGAGAGRDAETAAALRRAADADASDFEARLELGDALLGAGEYARASAAYERAAEIAPGDAPSAALLNNCGVLRAMTGRGAHEGRFEKARGWFLRALAAAHAESEGASGVGLDKKTDAATGEALDVSSARAKTPESALPVAFNLARLVEDRGMVAEAERRYRDLLVASPKMTECLLRLASMRAERRDFDGATKLAREALTLNAEDTDAMAFLGHLLMKQGRWAEAQAQFKLLRAAHKPLGAQAAQLAAAAGKDPKAATHATDEYAMISVGNAAYYQAMKAQSAGNRNRAGSDEKSSKAVKEHLEYAATMYTKALQKSESNLFAANGLGILLAEKGKIEEAKETFQMVAEGLRAAATNEGDESSGDANGAARDRASKFPDIWINQGHIQMAKGNWDAAARHYAQAQAKFFHNLDPSVMLYQARNQYESGTSGLPESQKTLRRALHVAPWNHRLRFNLAYVIQEKAQREMQTLLKAGQKIAGGGVAEDGGTKAARLQTAIDENRARRVHLRSAPHRRRRRGSRR